jgi:hypothetical protein
MTYAIESLVNEAHTPHLGGATLMFTEEHALPILFLTFLSPGLNFRKRQGTEWAKPGGRFDLAVPGSPPVLPRPVTLACVPLSSNDAIIMNQWPPKPSVHAIGATSLRSCDPRAGEGAVARQDRFE